MPILEWHGSSSNNKTPGTGDGEDVEEAMFNVRITISIQIKVQDWFEDSDKTTNK